MTGFVSGRLDGVQCCLNSVLAFAYMETEL